MELGGEADDGELLSLLGPVEMRWTREGDDWLLTGTRVGELREARARRFGFTEITDEVFGKIESFQQQISKDIDHWRGTLDAALGVQVYGHHGVSLGDYNGDGLDDLYISEPAGLPNRLYRNNGDGTFSDVTRAAGVDVLDDTSMSLFGDLDNDGDQDLILIGVEPLLFRNEGGKYAFVADAGLTPAPDQAAMLTGAALADYDLDGDLDLYVCAYDFWQAGSEYDAPTPYYDATNGPPNLLFRNRGDGTFEEVTAAAGLMEGNDRFSFAASWADYDNDGDPDLYVANDFGRNNLYRNNGDGTFRDVAAEAGLEDLAAGMSGSWGDYDNDGYLDLYVSNMWSSAGQRLTFNPAVRERGRIRRCPGEIPAAGARQLAVPQQRRRNVQRRQRDSRRHDGALGLGLRAGRPRQRRPARHLRPERLHHRRTPRRPLKLLLAAGRVAHSSAAERVEGLPRRLAGDQHPDPLRRLVERP